jgi:hypothetical protein
VVGRSGAFAVQDDAHRSAPVIGADRHAIALAAAFGVHEPAHASSAIIRPVSRL